MDKKVARAKGVAWCWGRGTTEPLAREGEYSKIGVGRSFYGLRTDGRIASTWQSSEPELVSDETFTDLSVAGDFACGLLRDDGRMRCFGSRVR